jgi:hypothetical protein
VQNVRAHIGCLGTGFGRWFADERGLYHDNRQSLDLCGNSIGSDNGRLKSSGRSK